MSALHHRLAFAALVVALLGAGAGIAVAAAGSYPLGTGTGGCEVFPASSAWHENISKLPVSPLSNAYIASIGANLDLHPDFGSNLTYGIPYAVVPASQPRVAIHFTAYGDQSDPGPYPIPPGVPIEGGTTSTGDRHVLVLQSGVCKLYELYSAYPNADGSWNAASGAVTGTWSVAASGAITVDGDLGLTEMCTPAS